MPSDLENLTARKSAIYAELAAISSTTAGGRPNINGGGMGTVDHMGYKKSLYEELDKINGLIESASEGPWEIALEGRPA